MRKYSHFYLAWLALALLLSNTASASESHPYIGIQVGMSFLDLEDTNDSIKLVEDVMQTPHVKTSNSGFSGRIYAGFQFVRYFGLELGYARFANSKSNVLSSGSPFITLEVDAVNRTSAFDALAVVTIPVTNSIAFNLKGGAAYVRNNYKSKLLIDGAVTERPTFNSRNIAPKVGAGIDYQLTQGFAIGLAYEFIPGRGNPGEKFVDEGNADFLPRIQVVSVNLRYAF